MICIVAAHPWASGLLDTPYNSSIGIWVTMGRGKESAVIRILGNVLLTLGRMVWNGQS